jgi:hypothetical protein
MPPTSQLVITKLGVQATATGDTVSGLLCLKVSLTDLLVRRLEQSTVLPEHNQSSELIQGISTARRRGTSSIAIRSLQRYVLLSRTETEPDTKLKAGNNPLKLTSSPEIHALPLPTAHPPVPLSTASRLLGLGSSYPPPQASSGWKPMVDVSSTTGQVFLVLDPRRSSPTKRDGAGGRRDWLVLMRFEQAVGRCIERGSLQV